MNNQDSNQCPTGGKKLAVGHFLNEDFIHACSPWTERIGEVFFAWPGVLSCRPAPDFTPELRERLVADLAWCRKNDIQLDALFNCNCYGEQAISHELENLVKDVMRQMDDCGLFPNVITTTSPFIATIIRRNFPTVKIRASVNLRAHGTIGFEAVSDIFDEFYLSREHHRDLEYVKQAAQWAKQNGKRIGIQLNSGCIRECPFQTFHDNIHGHNRAKQAANAKEFDFAFMLCQKHFGRDHAFEDIIRATWIRPEDAHLWEPYVSFCKLATRRIANPSKIVEAYASRSYDGNLLDLLDPVHSALFAPLLIDNKSFPNDWATSGIGAACAQNCIHCGRCAEVFHMVTKRIQ